MKTFLLKLCLLIVLPLVASMARANDLLAVRIEQTENRGRVISILGGVARGRQLIHHRQTVRCNSLDAILQRLEFARAQKDSNKIAVYETAQNDISMGNVDGTGQCESFTYRYGIVDLTQYNAGYRLFVETPDNSYIGKLTTPPDHPASYTMTLTEGSQYKKGMSGNHDDGMYALSDMMDDDPLNFSRPMNASTY